RRAGMENLPGVAALAAAVTARAAEAPGEVDRMAVLADRLLAGLADAPEVVVHGDPGRRLPHLVAFSILYVEGEALLPLLDAKGIAVHSGSSCTADTQEPSHVLAATGALTHGSVRVSFPRDATEAAVDRFLEVLPAAVADLREMAQLDNQAGERHPEGAGPPPSPTSTAWAWPARSRWSGWPGRSPRSRSAPPLSCWPTTPAPRSTSRCGAGSRTSSWSPSATGPGAGGCSRAAG